MKKGDKQCAQGCLYGGEVAVRMFTLTTPDWAVSVNSFSQGAKAEPRRIKPIAKPIRGRSTYDIECDL